MKQLLSVMGFLLSASIAHAECINFGSGYSPEKPTSNKTLKNNKLNSKSAVSQQGSGADCLTIKPEDPELYSAIAPKLPEKKTVAEAKVSVPGQDVIEGTDPMIRAAQLDVPKPVPTQVWRLRAGHMIGAELQEWAKRTKCMSGAAGDTWTVVWQVPKDWDAAANTSYTGDFKTVATQAVNDLAENGAIVRASARDANCTFVVFGPGVPAK